MELRAPRTGHIPRCPPFPYGDDEQGRAAGSCRLGRRWAGSCWLACLPTLCFYFFLFLFFFVEKKREEKKGVWDMKNYKNNFYELPYSKLSRFTSFGSEVFEISNYLNLKLNWHFGFNNREFI